MQQTYAHTRSQRFLALLGLVLLTLAATTWLGINLLHDIAINKPVIEPAISIYSTTPSSTESLKDEISWPRFAQEKLSIYGCLYGESTSSEKSTWALIGNKQKIAVGSDQFEINPNAKLKLSTLLLVPNDVILTKMTLIIDNILPPAEYANIKVISVKGCGQGGGVIPFLTFPDVVLNYSPDIIQLTPKEIPLPYQLNKGDVYNINIPIFTEYPGEYHIHIEADFVFLSGKVVLAKSSPLIFGVIKID